ncbi:uncharacterized protein ASCRUDRAFT_151146 [Ascoidea rubescens DSM 1968]|uniref:Uncharacterized protein n=1 Tax=Ascoidea rubescens DSM 1968 TaxID=1344418 RepID=A0A1D2VGX6_9ASCO|nr:hypothetical protein ASCRUDRAFT_151146 [Ascoidea rubescens DSM 1968]ODV60885.1 hypothetical protein ASCRUDRAFT_151146 [Ascoidea rubescens DSM 1968]
MARKNEQNTHKTAAESRKASSKPVIKKMSFPGWRTQQTNIHLECQLTQNRNQNETKTSCNGALKHGGRGNADQRKNSSTCSALAQQAWSLANGLQLLQGLKRNLLELIGKTWLGLSQIRHCSS